MSRLSDKLRKLEDKTEAAWIRVKPKLPRYAALAAAVLYLYGMFLRILAGEAFTWDPASNLPIDKLNCDTIEYLHRFVIAVAFKAF